MPYFDADGEVDCGHDWDDYCPECDGCCECGNCYCDDEETDFDPTEVEGEDYLNNWA